LAYRGDALLQDILNQFGHEYPLACRHSRGMC
jgi:hypothetical protein